MDYSRTLASVLLLGGISWVATTALVLWNTVPISVALLVVVSGCSWVYGLVHLERAKRKANKKLGRVRQIRAEQSAILRTMIEGVVTFDSAGLIRRINPAAYYLLDLPRTISEGDRLSDGVQDDEVSRALHDLFSNQGSNPRLVKINHSEPKYIELHYAPLQAEGLATPGSLLVIHNVTKIQKLERIRRDFVANVSHELRTPITSIKGFVETLLDGAMNEPRMLDKFLKTIERQAERLNSIFEDLLTLSRLEAGVGDTPLDKEIKDILEVVDAAVEECLPLAEAKQITLSIEDNLVGNVEINARFSEQALVNLIENAIKYSPEGEVIRLAKAEHASHIGISVVDKGIGIPEKHLPRLFERFYRVDPGRSRQMGGTGLGLAIVKHIAQLHGGWVSVKSKEQQGSTFTLYLPLVTQHLM